MLLLLCLLLGYCTLVSGQQCNSYDISVDKIEVDYGGMNGFYSIAKGISDGLQTMINDKTVTDINNLLFGTPPDETAPTTANVISDVVKSQAGAIVFWSVGFVFMLASIVFLIVTGCCQCCCSSCGGKPNGDRSSILAPVYILLFVVFFAFILTGIILFNVSITNLFASIDRADQFTNKTRVDISKVLTNGTAQMSCAIDTTTNITFSTLTTQMNNYAEVVFNNTKDQIGFTALNQFGLDAFSDTIKTTSDLGNVAVTELNAVTSTDAACTRDVTAMKKTIVDTVTNLNSYSTINDNIKKSLQSVNDQLDKAQQQVQDNVNSAIPQINGAQQAITSSMNGVNNAVNLANQEVSTLTNAIDSAHRDIVTWDGYSSVQSGLRAIQTTPATIALFFAFVAAISVIIVFIAIRHNNKSTTRKCTSIFVLIGFYLVLIFSILAMAVASFAFVFGWATSAVCVPVFEDSTFRFFSIVNTQTNIPGYDNNGPGLNVSLSQIFRGCYNNQTLFASVNGSQILSPELVDNQLNLTQYKNDVDTTINQQKFDFDFADQKQLDTLSQNLNSSMNVLGYQDNFLPDCSEADQNVKNANDAIRKFRDALLNVTLSLSTLTSLTTEVNDKIENNQTQAILQQQNDQQFDTAYANINSSISDLTNMLQNDVFNCRPLYQVFENSGNVICRQFGEPVHGLWAAAGLAGIMFLPLAIVLLCSYRWLRTPTESTYDSSGARSFGRSKENDISMARSNVFDVRDSEPVSLSRDITPYERPNLRVNTSNSPVYPSSNGFSNQAWATDSPPSSFAGRGLKRRN